MKLITLLKRFFFNFLLSNATISYEEEYCEIETERVFIFDQTILFADGEQAPLLQYIDELIFD